MCMRERGLFGNEQYGHDKKTFSFTMQRLTWQALRYADAPRAPPNTIWNNLHSWDLEMPHSTDIYKDWVNTLLLVSTLEATVTFAAAFTMPGGYSGSGGTATFLEKHVFQVFVICNTLAICIVPLLLLLLSSGHNQMILICLLLPVCWLCQCWD